MARRPAMARTAADCAQAIYVMRAVAFIIGMLGGIPKREPGSP
jgi:hypothetical protein